MDRSSQFPVFLFHHGGVFGNGDGVIVISDHCQNGNFRLCQREQRIDGILFVSHGLFGSQAVGLAQSFPVFGRTFSDTLAAGPAFEIAYGGIHIQARYLFRIHRSPVEGKQGTAAQAFQNRFGIKPVFPGHVVVVGIHQFHGIRGAVHIFHVDVAYMKSLLRQRDVGRRERVEKFRSPNPGIAGKRFVRHDHQGGASGYGEVQTLHILPRGFPGRCGNRGGIRMYHGRNGISPRGHEHQQAGE